MRKSWTSSRVLRRESLRLVIVIGFVACGFGECGPSIPVQFTQTAQAGQRLTYIDLINRLTDLEHLATLPAPGEKCAQFSSYDRRSKYDEATGKYVNWSANGDGTGIIRKENGELVFAEMQGPGVIWRIWSALAKKGHVKIYLDGADEPAVDLPFEGYFNCQNEPFTRPALVHETARGLNCYVPIPYQKSCKITAEGDWGRYYHFTYTTYPKGTILPTFKRKLSTAEAKALDRANEILSKSGTDPVGKRPGEIAVQKKVVVRPGEVATVAKLKGTRAITALRVHIIEDLPESPDDRDVLRELVLRIYWDGEKSPSVWAPLGDFFGTAPGVNKYKSLPLGMMGHGDFYSFWYMPFEKGALIELTNDGDKQRMVSFTISHAPVTKPIEKLGRFHAKWHRDAFLPEDPDRRAIDWTMLKTKGRGRYCGVMLHVWNPRGGWWGEGDEKFFIDGEKFPSTFGTGSEDYFGYAWCTPELFSNCYHNQTISMNNRGHVSVNRWHITDNVPFQKSFEAAIEKYYPNKKPTLYAATAYWYQAAGQADPYQAVPVEQRKGYWTEIKVFKVKGALEGERLKILAKTAGNARRQDLFGFGPDWSGDAHLWWTGAKPGDILELAVPVKKTAA
ncbi:MAG: glycoside hydrolase family 172 protein, partial [Sedimentisphaerales bacterium]